MQLQGVQLSRKCQKMKKMKLSLFFYLRPLHSALSPLHKK